MSAEWTFCAVGREGSVVRGAFGDLGTRSQMGRWVVLEEEAKAQGRW